MADVRSIKRRIRTAKNIAQITQAMEMVAASKMRRAQEQTLMTRPYSTNLYAIVSHVASKVEPGNHKYLTLPEEVTQSLLVLIGPDKGLCGGLLGNLLREFIEFQNRVRNISILTIGKKGKDKAIRLGANLIAEFPMGLSQPKYEMVVPIAKIISAGFMKDDFQEVSIAFTEFINTMVQKPTIRKLLPIEKQTLEELQENDTYGEYLFEPTMDIVLENLLPHYLEMEIYQVILEAYASEQSARMMAMRNATDNANDIMIELTLNYNKVRQQIITNEIADIATASLVVGTTE
jgi:F-type H+-transporting ATPase subunit gamma